MKITEINEINENLLTKYGSRAAERFGGGAEKAAAKELSKADKLAQAASTPPPVTSNVPKNLQGDPISVSPPATATSSTKQPMSLNKQVAIGATVGIPATIAGFAGLNSLNTKDKEKNMATTSQQNTPQAKPQAAPVPAAVTSAGASGPPGSFQRGAGIAAATANAARPNATTDPRSFQSQGGGAQAMAGSAGSAAAGNTARAPGAPVVNLPNVGNANLGGQNTSKPPTQAATTTPAAAPGAAPAQQGYQSKNQSFAQKVNQAAAASGLKDMNKIQPGQKIQLPGGGEHIVQKGETLSGIIAGKKAGGTTPAKPPAPVAPAPAAPVANANTTVNPLAGAKPPSPQPEVTPNVAPATQAATTTAPVLGTPENPYPQGAPVTSGSGETYRTSDGSALRTRSDAEIGDTNPRTGVVTPGSFDKNRAQGEKNLNSLKNLFGFGKKEAPAPAAPAASPATQSATTTPSAGTGNPLGGVKTPPASRTFETKSRESDMELNLLRKYSGLSEITESDVTVHKGDYGNKYEPEVVRDQYGHKIGKVNKGADGKKDAPKRGRGRPTKGDKDEHGNDTKFDTSGLQGMLGGKPKGEVGKKSVKHSLKDWIETVSDTIINEAGEEKTMSRAAKGHEKYGKEGMQALAKAGRDGASEKKLDTIRNKYDKYDTVEEAKDLPGNQDNLDVAPPKGKLTKADFEALRGKKKVKESLSFNEMMSETNIDMQDMLQELQQDIEHYNNTGHCSDKLEAFLKIHGHTKKRITDEATMQSKAVANAGRTPPFMPPKKPESGMGSIVQGTWQSDPRGTVKAPSGDPEGVKEAGSFIRNLASSRKAFEGKDMKDVQLENWEQDLNSLLNENITISTTIDDQGHDSVSVNATEGNAHEIIELLRNAGIGGMGGRKEQEQEVNNYGLPMSGDEHHGPEAQLIAVGDPHAHDEMGGGDDMMALIKKMTGIQDSGEEHGSQDYEQEEGHSEEHSEHDGEEEDEEQTDEGNAFSGAVAKAKSDDIPDEGQKFEVGGEEYPVKEDDMEEGNMFTGNLAKAREQGQEEADLDGDGDMEKVDEGYGEPCNECGGMMDEGHSCSSQPVVGEGTDEGFANSDDDKAFQDIAYMMRTLSGGGGMGEKRSQATGPIVKIVTAEGTLMKESTDLLSDFRKLSGI